MGSLESDVDLGGLPDILHTSECVSTDFTSIASTLNTAPVTLAALAKECCEVTSLLSRFQKTLEASPHLADVLAEHFNAFSSGLLSSVASDLSFLKLSADRIRPRRRDSGVTDVEEPASGLTIIWNEDRLKQALSRLRETRRDLGFLLDCVGDDEDEDDQDHDHDHDQVSVNTPTLHHASRLLQLSPGVSPALLNKGSRMRLAIKSPSTPARQTMVSQTPEIQNLLKQLKPDPGIPLRRSQKTCQQLHFAIDHKDEAAVLKLLLDNADPNLLQPGSSLTPLHRAFNVGSAPIATLLAIAGADLDDPTAEGFTPLMRGVRCGFSDTFTSLMCELGGRPEAVDKQGCSSLHYAAASRNEDDTIAVLVGAGADLELADFTGRTPLIAAVESGRLKAVDRLIEYGADIEVRLPCRKTPLVVAMTRRNAALTKLLADRGAFLDCQFGEHTALTFAISTACTDIAQILIDSGADVNFASSNGTFPLLAAVATGDVEVAKLLLSRGALVDKATLTGYTPMHMVAHKNRVEMLPLLVRAGAPLDPVNDQGETPLAIAVTLGHIEVADLLVHCGANVDHSPDGGESLLITALRGRKLTIASLLIDAGADLVTPDGEDGGITPVHLAAQLGLDNLLAAMVARRGVDLDTTVWSGYTPLHMAVEAGRISTVRLLLKHGADRFALDAWGGNLLAVATATPALLKMLIAEGLAVNHRDDHGATALHHAALRGHVASAKILLQKGARQFHASAVFESVEDQRDGVGYRQGTPAGLARQKEHAQVVRLIERWRFKS